MARRPSWLVVETSNLYEPLWSISEFAGEILQDSAGANFGGAR